MILDAELLEAIRDLLGVDAETLPDEVLTGPLLGGRVEADILRQVDYFSLSLPDQGRVRNAIALRTAAAALRTGKMQEGLSITQERFGQQYSVSRANPTGEWATELERLAELELAPLLGAMSGAIHFRLARGRRGA